MAVSLEDLAQKTGSEKIQVVTRALGEANSQYLLTNISPSRKVYDLDNRGSHFYLALYWAQALAAQDACSELKSQFQPIAEALTNNEQQIASELLAAQGAVTDIGGYYQPCDSLADAAMRPSETLNNVLAQVS